MDNEDQQLLALGKLISVVPEVGLLIAYRRTLPDWLPLEERREKVLARARELGLALGGERIIGGTEIPSPFLDGCVWQLLRGILTVAPVMYGPATCRELLLKVSAAIGLDDFLVAYVEETVKTGAPGHYSDKIRGGVVPVVLNLPGDSEPLRLVAAFASSYTRMEELIQDLRDKAYETFKDETVHEADTLYEAARVWELRQSGLNNSQIAWLFLSERIPGLHGLTLEQRKADFGDVHKKEMARLRQMKRRL